MSRLVKQQFCMGSMLFLYISLPLLHDYEVNFSNFMFLEDLNLDTIL